MFGYKAHICRCDIYKCSKTPLQHYHHHNHIINIANTATTIFFVTVTCDERYCILNVAEYDTSTINHNMIMLIH